MAVTVRIGLLLGDPCGIGPELVARLVTGSELDPDTATIVLGDPGVLGRGAQHAGIELRLPEVFSPDEAGPGTAALLRGPSLDLAAAPVGQASAAAGARTFRCNRTDRRPFSTTARPSRLTVEPPPNSPVTKNTLF